MVSFVARTVCGSSHGIVVTDRVTSRRRRLAGRHDDAPVLLVEGQADDDGVPVVDQVVGSTAEILKLSGPS